LQTACKQNVRHSVLPGITGGDNRLELRGMLAISQNHMSLDFAVDRTSAKLRCDSLPPHLLPPEGSLHLALRSRREEVFLDNSLWLAGWGNWRGCGK